MARRNERKKERKTTSSRFFPSLAIRHESSSRKVFRFLPLLSSRRLVRFPIVFENHFVRVVHPLFDYSLACWFYYRPLMFVYVFLDRHVEVDQMIYYR